MVAVETASSIAVVHIAMNVSTARWICIDSSWDGTGMGGFPRRLLGACSPGRLHLPLDHVLAAVDFDHLAGHVAAQLIGSEIDEGTGTFVWHADPVHRHGGLHRLELLRRRIALVEWRRDDAGRDRVDADVVAHDFLGPPVG